MLKKVAVAMLSAIIMAVFLAVQFYTPMAQRDSNVTYTFGSFWPTVLFFIMFSVPAYFLGGLPVSFIIDKFVKKKALNFFAAYIVSGFIVGILTSLVYFLLVSESIGQLLSQLLLSQMLSFGLYGALGALLFFLLLLPFGLYKNFRTTD